MKPRSGKACQKKTSLPSGRPSHPCIRVLSPAELADELSFELFDLGASAVELRDKTTLTAPVELAPGTDNSELLAGFGDPESRDLASKEFVKRFGNNVEIASVDVEDGEWETRWREFFAPVALEKLQVVTPWMAPPRTGLLTVVIDPGRAFGTGGHATTRLILGMLERCADKGGLPDEILDLGCGSGILAVAAAKLGAGKITAADIDEEAVAATRANASANGVGGLIEALVGSARDLKRTWPLVLANLQLSVFEESASDIECLIEPGGRLFLSGLLIEQTDRCASLWPDLRLIERLEIDEWAAVSLERNR